MDETLTQKKRTPMFEKVNKHRPEKRRRRRKKTSEEEEA